MSALRVVKIRRGQERPACSNRCIGHNGVRDATVRVTILGYPLPGRPGARPGYFCDGCLTMFRRVWDAALEGAPAPDLGRVCACGCGERVSPRSTWRPGHMGKDAKLRRLAA